MIHITPTPNYAGVNITGDFYAFDQLYESLHRILGNEEESLDYYQARLHVLGLCYDLRHAKMGQREYTHLHHGIDESTMDWLGLKGPKENLYLSFNTFYPEMLFIIMVLDDFIEIYERKNKIKYSHWNLAITTVRQFQATVIQSLSETLKPLTFKRMLSHINYPPGRYRHYFTQYIDALNIRFLSWDKEERLKNISIIAKRIAEQGKEYQEDKRKIIAVAHKENCPVSMIKYKGEYPDYYEIDW